MTKEEYERLLQSDYWKGYSYSLIKERNFTCQDCGRSFPNERHRLQVHHLVYRDINPWSYRPEEVVVLCKECHQKRHGIMPESEPKPDSIKEMKTPETDYYIRSYTSEYNTAERDIRPKPRNYPGYFSTKKKKRGGKIFLVFVCILAVVLIIGKKADDNRLSTKPSRMVIRTENNKTKEESPAVIKQQSKATKNSSIPKASVHNGAEAPNSVDLPARESVDVGSRNEVLSELNILDESIDVNVDNQEQAVEEIAKVSPAENLTFHEDVVKQAERAGVSTEGTTSEILDRINHASVVKQAERAGVSTEGTTSEILDRINKKNLKKYGQ